jgi:hypothetical protein
MLVCAAISLGLLVSFAALQVRGSSILNLDAKWLATAGLPLLVGFVVGGYITKFKGFGLELESKLRSPVVTLNLTATSSMATLPGDEKLSVSRLDDFTEDQVDRTKRLSFITGRLDHYDPSAIISYLTALQNLEYFEVKKETGEFVCLVPVLEFKRRTNQNNENKFSYHEVQRFVAALEANKVSIDYSHVCVSLTVSQDTSLLGTLRVLSDNGKKVAAVVTAKHILVGLLTEQEIEHRIANEIMSLSIARQTVTD